MSNVTFWKHPHNTTLPFLQTLDSAQCTALSFFTAILTSSVRSSSPVRNAFFILHLTFLIQAFLAAPPSNITSTAVTYTASLLLGNLCARYIDRLYMHVPERDFHRVNADGSKEDANQLPWPRKLLWAIELFCITRGKGWDWQVTGIPKAQSQTRSRFVIVHLLEYVVMYGGLYLVGLMSQNIRMGFPAVSNLPLREMAISISSNPVFLYIFIVLAYAITIHSHFGILTLPLSVLCVGLKLGPSSWQEPQSWPPNFGSLKDAYSIRRFWGRTWHQQLRRITSAPAVKILSLAPSPLLRSKTRAARLAKRYFLVMGAFFISGCIHACGSYGVTRAHGQSFSDGGEMSYFLIQGLALIIEDLTCYLLGIDDQARARPTELRRWLGYTTTGVWYIWSRVALKVVPLAVAHGIRDERGSLFAALELVERGVLAVPGNFVARICGGYRWN